MYRFYQRNADQKGSHETWLTAREEDVEKIRADSACHMTVLSVSETDAEDWDDVSYRGDLWFDLDAGSLEQSIQDLHSLMNAFKSVGVADLRYLHYFASGSKGFHVQVPAELFGGGQAVKRLPLIYRQMAIQLAERAGIAELDMKPYFGKRGGMLRVENKPRPDGRYKVPLNLEEVETITVEKYLQYVSAPRTVKTPKLEKGFPTPAILTQMYIDAKKDAQYVAAARKHKPVPDEALKKFGNDNHPLCVQWLAEGGEKVRKDVHWNQKALQMAAYLAHVEMSDHDREWLVEEISKNHTSRRFPSQSARKKDVHDRTEYAGEHSIRFACRAINSLLEGNPCQGCPVIRSAETTEFRYLVDETPGGYVRRVPKGDDYIVLPITFRLTAVHRDVDTCADPMNKAIESIDVDVMKDGSLMGKLTLPSRIFASAKGFKEVIGDWSQTWRGTEAELSDIGAMVKSKWLNQSENIEVIMKTKTLGLQAHIDPERNKEIWYYVEPDWSLNDMEVSDYLRYSGKEGPGQMVTRIKGVPVIGQRDPHVELIKETVRLLCEGNFPHIAAQFIGWNVAATLRPRMMKINREFPLLNIWGNPGEGKTASATAYSLLAGADFSEGTLQAPGVTPYALRNTVSVNSSIPTTLDEVNYANLDKHRWNSIVTALKAAYQGGFWQQGTVSRDSSGITSPDVIQTKAQTPVIWMCVNQLSGTAAGSNELVSRSLEVHVSKDAHKLYGKNFKLLQRPNQREQVKRIYATLVRKNLFVDQAEFEQFYEKSMNEVPSWLEESRSRTNYGTVILGLNWLADLFAEKGFPEEEARIFRLKEQYLDHINEDQCNIEQRRDRREADNVLEAFNILALQDQMSANRLSQGKHYVVMGDSLYLRLNLAILEYLRYKRSVNQTPEIVDAQHLLQVCKSQPYFKTYGPVPGASDGNPWLGLFLSEMRRKGIDVSGFKE